MYVYGCRDSFGYAGRSESLGCSFKIDGTASGFLAPRPKYTTGVLRDALWITGLRVQPFPMPF